MQTGITNLKFFHQKLKPLWTKSLPPLACFLGNSSRGRNIIEFPIFSWRQNGRSTKVRHENFPNSKICCMEFYTSHDCHRVWGNEVERSWHSMPLAGWWVFRSPTRLYSLAPGVPGEGGTCFSLPSAFAQPVWAVFGNSDLSTPLVSY